MSADRLKALEDDALGKAQAFRSGMQSEIDPFKRRAQDRAGAHSGNAPHSPAPEPFQKRIPEAAGCEYYRAGKKIAGLPVPVFDITDASV